MSRVRTQDVPIWRHIAGELRDSILGGKVGLGGRLPTEHELCARYGVSRTSAMRALNTLVTEGLVRRERGRGRGTTVIATADPSTQTQCVPIILPQTGHYFDPLAQHLAQHLSTIQRYPILFTAASLVDDGGWRRLQGLGGIATIIHGTHSLTAGMDRHWRSLPFPVFIGRWPGRSFRASLVEIDRGVGLRSAVQLALTRGCRSLIYFQHHVSVSDPRDRAIAEELRTLASAAGIPFHDQPIWNDRDEQHPDRIRAMLSAAGPKTVVLCGADFFARDILTAATALGWRMGTEFGLVGCNNTPWADALNIDSVSLQEDETAQAAVRLIQGGTIGDITVPSRLVERGSIPTW